MNEKEKKELINTVAFTSLGSGEDNLAIMLCTYFDSHPDNPDNSVHGENCFSDWALERCDEMLEKIANTTNKKEINPNPIVVMRELHEGNNGTCYKTKIFNESDTLEDVMTWATAGIDGNSKSRITITRPDIAEKPDVPTPKGPLFKFDTISNLSKYDNE